MMTHQSYDDETSMLLTEINIFYHLKSKSCAFFHSCKPYISAAPPLSFEHCLSLTDLQCMSLNHHHKQYRQIVTLFEEQQNNTDKRDGTRQNRINRTPRSEANTTITAAAVATLRCFWFYWPAWLNTLQTHMTTPHSTRRETVSRTQLRHNRLLTKQQVVNVRDLRLWKKSVSNAAQT